LNLNLSTLEPKAKILVADVDSEFRNLLAQYLRQIKFDVLTAENAHQALQMIIKRPDLAVIDLSQSRDDQRRVIKALAERNIPVIVLSAHDLLNDKIAVFEAGASDFLAKPFSPRELEYRTQALLRRSPPKQNTESTLSKSIGQLSPRNRDPYRIVGESIDRRYELLQYAGGGGMGAVYRASDTRSDKIVAVKILKPDVADRDAEYTQLFEKEVLAARKMFHPHIVQVLGQRRP